MHPVNYWNLSKKLPNLIRVEIFIIKFKSKIYDTHVYTAHVIQCTMITCIKSILISHDQNMNIETHTNPENNHNVKLY